VNGSNHQGRHWRWDRSAAVNRPCGGENPDGVDEFRQLLSDGWGSPINEITDMFTECKGVIFEQRGNRIFETDLVAKKVKMFTALGTEATNASDQSSITNVKFIAFGR